MRRFINNRWPQYRIWTNTGKEIKFTDGVFETEDDDLCRFLYSDAMKLMVPRFIQEVDATVPAHGEVPEGQSRQVPEVWFCNDCEKGFPNKRAYDQHMKMARNHGGYPSKDELKLLEEVHADDEGS